MRMRTKIFVFVLIYNLLVSSTLTEGHVKLNVPRVRLPYFDSIKVNFTLEVDTPGCYIWTVSRPNMVLLTTIDGKTLEGSDCARSVLISAVPKVSPCCPAHTIVFAEEQRTKETLRCDVTIDKISSIAIVTNTKEIFLEETPSLFQVRAYGITGNEFSTLQGVPFTWWIQTVHEGRAASTTDASIMRFIPFYESTYQVSQEISELESRRLQGSQVLIEGLKTGAGTVFTRIIDPLYKTVSPAEGVKIVVVANVFLEPREAYVLPDTKLRLKLLQVKQGAFNEIKLPSPNYVFQVNNNSVASYDIKTSLITARNYGEAKIIVLDKNNPAVLKEEEHPEALVCSIYVVVVKFLSLTIWPFRSVFLEKSKEYEITIELYDADNQQIFVGENVKVATKFDPKYWRVDFSSKNGTYYLATALTTGGTRILSEMEYITKRDGSKTVYPTPPKVHLDVQILQPIEINPSETILPWDPVVESRNEIQFNASGGDGVFSWASSNDSVVAVRKGVGLAGLIGAANITAFTTLNSNIKGQAKVYVLPPVDMQMDDNVEGEIKSWILVPLTFFTIRPDDDSKKMVPYTDCQRLPFKVDIEDPSFSYDSNTHFAPIPPACAFLPIKSDLLGSSLVTVTYQAPDDRLFMDSVVVSTFKPLKVIEPVNLRTVLAVGSSRQLVFNGGPRPLLENGFFRRLHIENDTVAQGYEFKSKPVQSAQDELYIYEVICREIGETYAIMETGSTHSLESVNFRRTAAILIVCAEPKSIYFKLEKSQKHMDGVTCPLEYMVGQFRQVPVPNYEKSDIRVVVKDPKGRTFDNITSLVIEWETSIPLLTFKNLEYISTLPVTSNGYSIPGKSLQSVIPRGESGNAEITATIKGYRMDIIKRLRLRKDIQLSEEGQEKEVQQRSYSMELNFVAQHETNATEITLFNHPSHSAVVSINEGSGYFSVNSTSAQVSKFEYFENNRTILIYPVNEGTETIVVQDLCLPSRRISEISVRVNGVGTLELDVSDKLELGKQMIAIVRVFGKQGNFLSEEDLMLIKLKPSLFSTEILLIKQLETIDKEFSGVKFSIKGKNAGLTSLTFTAESDGRITRSISKKITVFSPLLIHPKNLSMLVGSMYQFTTIGGPIDAQNNFTVDSSEVASVSLIGLMEGLTIGKTKVAVTAIDRIASTQVSEDTSEVKIVPFKGIRIQAPASRILRNCEAPVWAVELEENLEPSVLLSDKYPLTFEWQISNKETAEIYHSFQKYGFSPSKADQISMRLKGKQAGHATIKLIANYSGQIYMDEIEIEVLEELKLITSENSSYFLMTPNSELNLKTNRDATGKVMYTVQSSRDSSCFDRDSKCLYATGENPVVTVDKGIVRSLESSGVAVILIHLQEESGIMQTVSVIIEVKTVAFLMINPELSVHFIGSNSVAVPRGIIFPMKVTYHDQIGRTFDSTNLVAKARPNRFDLFQLNLESENNTFISQTLSEGRIAVKMFVQGSVVLRDYLILSIAEVVNPNLAKLPLSVGDVVCLSCSVQSKTSGNGIWSAHPIDSMHISQGIGIPIKYGQIRLDYIIPGAGLITSTEFTVKSVSRISLQNLENHMFITNGDPNISFDVSVFLGVKTDNLYGSNCTDETLVNKLDVLAPFICELEYESSDVATKVSESFSVKPVFRFDNRRYGCRIQPIENQKSPFYTSTIKSNIIVTARIKSVANEIGAPSRFDEIRSTPLKLKFYPAVYFHISELSMTNQQKFGLLAITGAVDVLNQLTFVTSDASYLEIKSGERVNPKSLALPPVIDDLGGFEHSLKSKDVETRTFKVLLLDNYWSSANLDQSLSVTIISQITKQKIQIPVKLRLTNFVSREANWEGWWSIFGFLRDAWSHTMSAVFVVIVTLTLVHLGSKYMLNVAYPPSLDDSESLFISSPQIESSHIFGPRTSSIDRLSFSPKHSSSGGGDTGYTSQRLFSTQSTHLYSSSPYLKRTPST